MGNYWRVGKFVRRFGLAYHLPKFIISSIYGLTLYFYCHYPIISKIVASHVHGV